MEINQYFKNSSLIQSIMEDCHKNNKNILVMGCGGVSMRIIADYLIKNQYIINGVDTNVKKIPQDNQFNHYYTTHNENNINDSTGAIIVSHFFVDGIYPELEKAKQMNIPIILRIDFLNYLCHMIKNNNNIIGIIGTCGKTTTTYLGFCLDKLLGNNPSIFSGSFIPMVGSNYHMDTGNVFIENDESRDEHLRIFSDKLIFTSIGIDHLEEKCYNNDYDQLKLSLIQQVNQSKEVIYYSDNGEMDQLISKTNKTIGQNAWSYSDVNENSHCFLESFHSSPLGSTGVIIIKKSSWYKKLMVAVPFLGKKNFLNYMAHIFWLINENNYKKIINVSRFIHLAPERNTYCGQYNNMLLVNSYCQIVDEFKSVAENYSQNFPDRKIYMAIEFNRFPRYNREVIKLQQLFPWVEKILLAPPLQGNIHYNINDPQHKDKFIHRESHDKIEQFNTIDDFQNAINHKIKHNNEPGIMLFCCYSIEIYCNNCLKFLSEDL